MDKGVRVFPLVVGNSDASPGFKRFNLFDQLVSAAAKGYKLYSLTIQFRKILVIGELGVEDKHGLYSSTDTLPKGKEGQNLIVCLLAVDICGSIEYKPAAGILSKEGERPFHAFPSR